MTKAALLYEKHRFHFALEQQDGTDSQVMDECNFKKLDSKKKCIYTLHIKFNTSVFGSFHQSVVFDFDSRPVVKRDLLVDVGSHLQRERLEEIRTDHDFDK